MEITGIVGQVAPSGARPVTDAVQASRSAAKSAALNTPDLDIEKIANDLEIVSHAFNRRLKFSVNRELNQVVVKVIDKNTDKVIKELPSEEIQRLHVRIREAIGLLIDEEI